MMTMARGRRIAGAGPSSDAAETGSGRPLSSDDDGRYMDDSDYDSDLDRASLCSSFRSDFGDSSESGSSDRDSDDGATAKTPRVQTTGATTGRTRSTRKSGRTTPFLAASC